MDWKKEVARDVVAIGGLPFFVLVLVRVWILDVPSYFMQFFVAGLLFGLVWIFVRQDYYSGLGLIVLVFTAVHYGEFLYWILGSVMWGLLIGGLFYLGKDWKKVVLGVVVSGICIAISFIYPSL